MCRTVMIHIKFEIKNLIKFIMKLIKFQLSDELFWGYQITIDIDVFHSSHDIIEVVKNDMIIFFKSHNLLMLSDRIQELPLHMPCINSLKNNVNAINQVIYICSHEHSCSCSCNNI